MFVAVNIKGQKVHHAEKKICIKLGTGIMSI